MIFKQIAVCLLAAACCLATVSCGNSKKAASSGSSSSASNAVSISSSSSGSGSETGASSQAAPSQAASSHTASSAASARETVTVTIPEGFSVPQVGARLEQNGVCSEKEFLTAVNSYPFTEPSVKAIPYNSSKMCFRLEGYLFPDTYEFYKNMKAQDVIGKMLANADSEIVGKYSFQTVILASIIQKEVPDAAGMKNASSVFHNRLNNTKKFPYLGSDATVIYLTSYIASVDKLLGTDLVDKYKAYYNTGRRVKGLPAGPICNPGIDALEAAAHPASTNYLYFASDANGNYTFSATPISGATSS